MEHDKNNPLISVIVPVYRVEAYLDRCLASITGQSYRNLEILLVDDGSPDRCPQMCDAWASKDDRIRVIHKENGGLSSARNAGLAAATGEYIGFVDSDDWIATDMYEHLYEILSSSGAEIACGEMIRVKEESADTGKVHTPKIRLYQQEEYMKFFFKVHSNKTVHYMWNKLYTREVAECIHFPEGRIDEDVEGFFLALAAAERVVTSDKILYFYWVNPNGISGEWFSRQQMDLLVVWKHVLRHCEALQKETWTEWAKINFYRAYFGLLCRLMLSDDQEEALYIKEKQILFRGVRKYYRQLIQSSIPFSRKILLTMMCINYNGTRKLVKWGRK